MTDTYMEIQEELQLMQRELQERLAKEETYAYDVEFGQEFLGIDNTNGKNKLLLHDMREDLKDVERALLKMEIGMYGICEETGQRMTLRQLKAMPTARTVYECFYGKVKTI
ncbi:molecular chaperone DnaK [Bacillus rhizoplanae]|uniref:molecular chaperone DnaK n=1 Tax=Bacillus rhizoplanae TaxID=2880966 RepID=UPI003D1EA70C